MLNFNCVLRGSSNTCASLINYQSVRWRKPKKPFWLGIAKSKMFVLPKTRIIRTDEEAAEIYNLRKLYNTQMKSVLNFIKNENPLTKYSDDGDMIGLEKQKDLNKKIEESLIKNDEWNAVSAGFREKRLKESAEKQAREALIKMENIQKKEKEQLEKIEEAVRLEKERSKTFVTIDNLDEAIDNCLKNVVEYNYAIDTEGNKHMGKDPIKVERKEEEIQLSEIN